MRVFFFLMSVIIWLPLHDMNGMQDSIVYQMIRNDHRLQRTCAILNRRYNALIEKYYRPDKKRIEALMSSQDTPIKRGEVSWNKDFNRCAWVTEKISKECADENKVCGKRKHLEQTLVGLIDNKIVMKQCIWHGYRFPAIYGAHRLYFNAEDAACFHAYGGIAFEPDGDDSAVEHLVEYSLNIHGTAQMQRCAIETGTSRTSIFDDFANLFNLPRLLAACLQSTRTRESVTTDYHDTIKLYHLDGVTISEDYKLFKRHPIFGFLVYGAYNDLVAGLKYAIDKRYEEQQRVKWAVAKK